ncbi:DUF5916 domain-containing protein [Pseudofulvimonas gallinarii]|uniref:DUF5916 domain-containing protein n=1 Tax=Pseudofulvimonas gallinarii TaxID=634155 RepID=UPI0035E88010
MKPRANRDGGSNADRVNFAVDLDGDGRLAYNFMVTLGNAIGDEVITNENQYNADWDGVWRHALHEGEDRWSVEMLIPWSVAAMREGEGAERSIAVYFDRVIAARNERSAAPHASYTRPRFVSEFARVQVPRHRGGGVLAIVPYASVQYDLLHDRGEGRAGLDLFWKPSGRFQLSAALNPDFGQVEADDLVVNFDAIEVFFSDKRPFFTENQGIFNVTTPDSGRLVYTRRIGGGRDDGEGAADIDAAIKLNGSAGGFDYGTLVAIESGHATTSAAPSSYSGWCATSATRRWATWAPGPTGHGWIARRRCTPSMRSGDLPRNGWCPTGAWQFHRTGWRNPQRQRRLVPRLLHAGTALPARTGNHALRRPPPGLQRRRLPATRQPQRTGMDQHLPPDRFRRRRLASQHHLGRRAAGALQRQR